MTWLGFECSSCGNQTDRDTAVGLCTLCGGIRLARYDLDGLRGKLTHTELAGRSAPHATFLFQDRAAPLHERPRP